METKEYTIKVGEVFTQEKADELRDYLEARDKDLEFFPPQSTVEGMEVGDEVGFNDGEKYWVITREKCPADCEIPGFEGTQETLDAVTIRPDDGK